jgi:RNA polymerase sigma-70 factor (ECF subfamily)
VGVGGNDSHEALTGATAPAADGEWAAEFNQHVLRAALGAIEPRFNSATWQAFDLVWLRDCAVGDAAQRLGIPVAAVYVAKSRVLKELRKEILILAENIPGLVPLG